MHASMGRLRDDMAVLVLGPDPQAPAASGLTAATEPTPKESDG
jgi:hypothetical protein